MIAARRCSGGIGAARLAWWGAVVTVGKVASVTE